MAGMPNTEKHAPVRFWRSKDAGGRHGNGRTVRRTIRWAIYRAIRRAIRRAIHRAIHRAIDQDRRGTGCIGGLEDCQDRSALVLIVAITSLWQGGALGGVVILHRGFGGIILVGT